MPSIQKNQTLHYKFLSEKIFDQVKVNPEIPVNAVQDQLQHDLELQISMSKAFRAKTKAEREIRGCRTVEEGGCVRGLFALDSASNICVAAKMLGPLDTSFRRSGYGFFLSSRFYRTLQSDERSTYTARASIGVLKMLTAQGRVLDHTYPIRLALRYPSDSSSLDSSLSHSSLGYAISEVFVALSPVRADLSPPPKRIRDSDSVTDLEVSLEDGYEPYVPREVGLGVDVEDSYEPTPSLISTLTFRQILMSVLRMLDAIRDRGMDDRDVVETAAEEEVESRERDTVEVEVDPRVGPVIEDDVRESVREDVLDHRFHDHAIEIPVHQIQVIESEQRLQGHRITRVDLEVTTMTEKISALEQDNTRLRGHVGYLKSREIKNDQQDNHVEENVNHGNGNGNGNGNPNMNNRGVVPVARECTYQDFVKCQSLNFKGTEGVVGLTRWFEKMETMFHISNCPPRYQVKYASCTLIDGALTWNEIQKMETELWNLTVKSNNLTAYNQRFQELTMLCTKMVPEEEDKDAICVANNLMDQKLKGYATKNAENKRRFDSSLRDNHGQQQQPFKMQNISGQNVAELYCWDNVERKVIFWSFAILHGYAVSSLMDTAYWSSEQSMLTATHTEMTQDAIHELIAKRVDEALKAYDAARNPEIEAEIKNDQQDDHFEENVNHGNGNENGNGNPNVNNEGVVPVARECTYKDFVKCQPLNFKGIEGVVGLTRWFKKMETLFYISNCPPRYQVKYASCTLMDGALTWWNSYKRTIRVDDTYSMTWKVLMKLMTGVYCPRNEIQKMETEL
ncbi:hypothetical protein Tco_1295014 [Tanacetum coccineum]